jgi:hypothetical protein
MQKKMITKFSLVYERNYIQYLNLQGDFSTATPAAIFLIAHDVYNATGVTTLTCEMAIAKRMSVLMMFVRKNATEKVPFFLRANEFDRTCPIVWFYFKHEHSSLNKQESATDSVFNYFVFGFTFA